MGQELFAVSLASAVASWSVCALVVHALVCLASRVSTFKRYTAKQMLIALLVMFASAFAAGGRVVVRTVGGLLRWWLLFAVVFTSFSFVYVTYTEFPDVWLGTARFYNGNIGPFVHQTVIIPLKITDILLRGLLPLWDSGVWFVKALAVQGLLPVMIKEVDLVKQMATTLIGFVEHLSNTLLAFVTAFFCDGQACLHPEKGVLDILSPMGDVREFAALGVKLLRGFCSTLAAPIDLIVFPLMDINLAEGVHNLVNAAIQLMVVIPRATAVRCGLAHDDQFKVLMCTPDMAPFYNFLAAGVSSVGLAVDNWANVALLIVEAVTSGSQVSSQCDPVTSGMMPDLVNGYDVFAAAGSLKVVVGLTDWMYAVTDGATAVYMGHTDGGGGQIRVQTWPHPGMDARMGVAAVTYSSVHDLDVSAFSTGKTAGSMQTTAMLACNCSDDSLLGMRILCSILPMTGVPSSAAVDDYLVQVLFPDTLAAKLYVCAGVDIYVKSVRWSFTRYASDDATLGSGGDRTALPTADCITRGTCRELDATVWVVPLCGQERNLNAEKACIDEAPCFPFCMAARSAGSGRDNLMLARAGRWREGLTILEQDCAVSSTSPGMVGNAMGTYGTTSWATVSSTGVSGSQTDGVFASTYDTSRVCMRSPRVTSVMDHPSLSGVRAGANVKVSGQPFAITGDTTLMEVDMGNDGVSSSRLERMVGSVQVERLEGNEVSAFSLRAIAQTLPSLPRVLVPLQEAERTDTTKVTVPYSYQTTRIAAVSSRNYVFYASNPNLDVFGAYFEYCSSKWDKTKLQKMGLLVMTSFAPMRIYRVSAYRRCATYSCGADLVRFTTIDGFDQNFDRECALTFNVSVVAMEYLNEDNIAVTVQSSHVGEYDPKTQMFAGTKTRSTTYWLNPATMGVQTTIWQTTIATSQYAVLCPSMQRLPRVGSFAAEIANSAVFVLKYVTSAVLYTPGMVSVWRAGGMCPSAGGAASYHSILGRCGAELYSLDDFFDSVDDATAIFWHSLSLIGKLIAPTSHPAIAAPLTQVLDGMSQYGDASIDIWSARAGILTLTRVPIKDQMTQLWASTQPGTKQQGLSYGSSALSGWSRFSYKALSTMAVELVKRLLSPTASLNPLTVTGVFKLIWATLYDLKDEFEAAITSKNRMGCAGLKLIFGLDNPWSDVVYYQCAASAELTNDLMRLGINMFVLIPMAKCVCKSSQGQQVSQYVVTQCAPSLPVSLVPTLYTIANEASGSQLGYDNLRCSVVLEFVKGQIAGSLDAWFENQHLGLAALGSSVDYATATFDSKAGRCLDFANDPHTVVIVPQPVDYFQRCSKTSMCKQKCKAEWTQFQESVASTASDAPQTTRISVVTESAFFPGAMDPSLLLDNATASVEVPVSMGVCRARPRTTPPDYVLAVAELVGSVVRVGYWCAPLMSSARVYRNESSGYGPTTLPGTVLSVQFGDESGTWIAALVQMPGGQRVFLVNKTDQYILPAFEDVLPTRSVLMKVENMWVIEGLILVDLVTRRMVTSTVGGLVTGASSQSVAIHAFLRQPIGEANATVTGMWFGTDVDLMPFGGGQYWYTKRPAPPQSEDPSWSYLFLPKLGGARDLQQMRFSVTSGGTGILWLTQVETTQLQPADLSGLKDTTMAAVSQSSAYIFSTSTTGWDWLKQTRMDSDGFVTYASASASTATIIVGSCNELSCEGCQTLAAQRLCLAFNRCALINCVGTPVHQLRPLCGIGGVLMHWGEMSLRSTQGSWTVFTEMLALTLQLNMMTLQEAHLLWPDDAFMCYVCEAKDATAEFFSILTSTLNSALQLGGANVAYMYGGASNVDTNADAALTISSTALNGFMHQMALLPLFLMISSRQVMMCQVSGVLALLDEEGFQLRLQPADGSSASDIIAGQCLTVGAEVLATHPGDSPESLASTVGSIASNAMQLLLIQQIEPLLHFMDSMLAYVIGVVHTLGVLVMSQNMAVCNPPDFSISEILTCACGDHRLQIPRRRSTEGLADGALWCTGVLSMVDSNNQPYYVYNKYTYAELQALASGLDAYAKCMGTGTGGYKCVPPSDNFFAQQGVTVPNVLVKCRENYAEKRWDPFAFAFYNRAYNHLFGDKLGGGRVEFPATDPFGTRECLQGDASQGNLADKCLQQFLDKSSTREEDYWAYERTDEGKNGSQFTDACLVFSGPADRKVPLFVDCVDGTSEGRCSLAGHVWTPLSENSVPVGKQHKVMMYGTHADGQIQLLYQAAHALVTNAVDASTAFQLTTPEHVDVEFFSVEGDVLHQMMDCMFMGPYSRVDYWPIPDCVAGEECLAGPYWARDEGEGETRGLDPNECPAVPTLPLTCGSMSRRALMRYLVKDVLPNKGNSIGGNQNGSVIHETMLLTLATIRQDWANTSRYGCACGGGDAFLPTCCTAQTTTLLPAHLNNSYIPINTATVLQAIEDNMGEMYMLAMEATDPWTRYLDMMSPDEKRGYMWNESQRPRDEARFNPTQPVSAYSSAEAMNPLLEADGTLWDVCHAALKQTFFTLPIKSDGFDSVEFDPALTSFDGDPRKLEAYVKAFTYEAWRHSPLFRHYSPRHAPSDSNMCAHTEADPAQKVVGSASFAPFMQAGTSLLASTELPSDIPVFSAHRFRVGEHACLCGWERSGDRCSVPLTANTHAKVCAAVQVCSMNDYSYHVKDEASVVQAFSPAWYCPEFELSPHWGYTDPGTSDRWMGSNESTLTTASRDLLRHGRAGLRLGNVWSLGKTAKESIRPEARTVPLERGKLTTCLPTLEAARGAQVDPSKALLDELFPAAQAVEESGAASYCLRYVIEIARLEILRLVQTAPGISAEAVTQEERVALWHRRCGAQLHLLHLCVNLGVYRPRLAVPTRTVCSHFKVSPDNALVRNRRAYATKECLVSADGEFYDPCRCMECVGNKQTELDLEMVVRTKACKIRFDPRTMLEETDVPIGWFDGLHPLPDPASSLLRDGFKREVLEDADAVGNTGDPTSPWWATEGVMSETGEFCDGVLDWWHEEWDYPVGYHVTVPCDAGDTAYRSFAQAFALDEAAGALVYQNDLLRDAALADTHFGVNGLCRRGNFGMPLYVTNNMQYCTSLPVGGDTSEDFTVPGTREHAGDWSDMKCSATSGELPWPDSQSVQSDSGLNLYVSSLVSVGTVPNMPREFAAFYPETEQDVSEVGPWQDIVKGGGVWGTGASTCQDFELTLCSGAAPCPDGYACRGAVCSEDRTLKCTTTLDCGGWGTCGGVCLDSSENDCVKHSDCSATQMCSGVGRCVQPMLVVQNQLEDEGGGAENSISFGLAAAGECGAGTRNFSLVGASYWGNTGQDLLRVHGMCSFEDWFKYTQYYGKQGAGCSAQSGEGSPLSANPSACSNMKLDVMAQNQSRWWPAGAARPELMYLRPTNCDRDYERVKGFTQCAPLEGRGAKLLSRDGASEPTQKDQFVRLHLDRTSLMLAAMPERNDTTLFGVLGLSGSVQTVNAISPAVADSRPYVPCAIRGQCFAAPFTVDGVLNNRSYTDPTSASRRIKYEDASIFKCGSFGLEDPANLGCRLDPDVLPLFVALCRPVSNGGVSECQSTSLFPNGVGGLCENVREQYQPTNLDRTTNLAKLQEVFYAFPSFRTMDEYLNVALCMTSLYSTIAAKAAAAPGKISHGVYYPMMFVLKELPFDWFYQCIVMGKTRISETSRRNQDCVAYKERLTHGRTGYRTANPVKDAWDTYLRFVRGGYTLSGYVAYRDARMVEVRTAVLAARAGLQAVLYPGSGDKSYPQCSQNMVWKIGPYGAGLTAVSSPSSGGFAAGIANGLTDDGDVVGNGDVTYTYNPDIRAIVANWFDAQECRDTWMTGLIRDLPPNYGITTDNWAARLSMPDPLKLEPQGYPDETMLDAIQTRLLSSMRMIEEATIITGGTGVARFYNEPPPHYDLSIVPLSRDLIPTRSLNQGEAYMDNEDSVARVCAFLPASDPAIMSAVACTQVPASAARPDDKLLVCGGKPCTSVPVLARRNGQFNCRYIAAGNIIQTNCTESLSMCYKDVLKSMYAEMLRRYKASASGGATPPILDTASLPWFEEYTAWFAGLDMTDELDYERNIQPNQEHNVMCELTDASKRIDYTQCNSPHYLKLKAHAKEHYKHDAGVVIPAGSQLEWPVERGVLQRGVILSYTNLNRPLKRTYMDALFDDDTVCKGEVTGTQRVCWNIRPQEYVSINPWMLGNFNPFEVCDVDFTSAGEGGKEYIYTQCLKDNPQCTSFLTKPVPNSCQSKHKKLVSYQGVPRSIAGESLDYNLCFHKIVEESTGCFHDQGLLGGFDGTPVAPSSGYVSMLEDTKYLGKAKYVVGNSLYEESEWEIPVDFRQGMYAGTNPLWQNESAPYGHLQTNDWDIGGHRIGVTVSRAYSSDIISRMLVERLPMGAAGTDSGFLDGATQATSRPTSSWVPGLKADMAAEHAEVSALYRSARQTAEYLAPSCPLQRWLYYSGGYAAFSPAIPSALRARHLFHRIHEGLLSHPTMARASRGEFLGRYRSSNGFCACPVIGDISQQQCLVPSTADQTRECSLAQTIQSLKGGPDAIRSHVFAPLDHMRAIRQCTMQLDWPNVNGTLRDGSLHAGSWDRASSPTHRECHILDRFLPFRYRYRVSPDPFLASTSSSTIKAGVCQTARVVSLKRGLIPAYARCLRQSAFVASGASTSFTCNVSAPVGSPITMPRRQRLSKAETMYRRSTARRRCSKCSPPPAFKSESGKSMPPESSFGRLYRHSVERMLAKDLQEALKSCNGSLACQFNQSAWQPGEFMLNYMHTPERLFKGTPAAPAKGPEANAAAREQVWGDGSKEWVYCPSVDALKTGEGCKGRMTRRDWVERKTTLCPRMVRSYSTAADSGGDPMARTPFCSLDRSTDLVCKAVAEAKALVIKANCLARGDKECMPNPFVYTPSSYVASNNAWVHDSVQAFYLKINSSSCPLSAESALKAEAQTAFYRNYQLICPANALTLVEKVLVAVRVIVTDVALLLSSMMTMAVELLALLMTGNTNNMRETIVVEWLSIKTKGAAMMRCVSDILVDGLLNSGEMGKEIISFLLQMCEKIQEAATWFLGVWCQYIQKYMIQLMMALKKLVGIIGAGFEMLQDFVDEIFQGILPAAFVQKYASAGFQQAMESRYSEPTSHNDRGRARNNVPTSANSRPISRVSNRKNKAAGIAGMALSFLSNSPIGKLGGVIDMASGVYDLVQGAIDMAAEERLAEMWPDNFTLFGYSDITNMFDDMEAFLLEDSSCYVLDLYQKANRTYQMFPCLSLDLRRYAKTTAGTTAIDATQCWADAVPSLGQNSLFACTSSSTCCETTACLAHVTCGACATPAFTGVNKYGCDDTLRKCVCGPPKLELSKCSSNMQCDASSQCELVSSMNGVSYGTTPCQLCASSSQVLCLLKPTGMPGRCVCMLDSAVRYDVCNDLSGMETGVDSSKLCGYLHGQTGGFASFDMENLMIVPCSLVYTGICSTVYNTGFSRSTLRMVVAASIRGVANGGARRLLMEEDVVPDPGPPVYQDAYESEYELLNSEALHDLLMEDGWNTTAAPCSTLALAYQESHRVRMSPVHKRTARPGLGVLETFELHKCGFWRFVGRRVLERHHLLQEDDDNDGPMSGHETFLLSMNDLLFALMSDNGAGMVLMRNPGVFWSALMYHPWMKPLRAVGVLIANRMEHLKWIRDIDADVHEALFGDPPLTMSLNRIQRKVTQQRFPPHQGNGTGGSRGRRLMSVIDTVKDVEMYSQQVIKGAPHAVGSIPARVAGAWSTSSFVWPPVYDYSTAACPLAQSVLQMGRQVAVINTLYFKSFRLQPAVVIDRSLRGNLPGWSWIDTIAPLATPEGLADKSRSWASAVFHWMLELGGVRPEHLVAFFRSDQKWSLQWILETSIKCDLASVLTCSRHDKDLVMSSVVFLLGYVVVRAVTGALGVGFLSTMYILSYPGFIVWYVFGMGPSCFPMVPTCLLSDVIATVEILVPAELLFPPNLLCHPGETALNQSCLRSCTDLGFNGWEDPLAFAVCDTDARSCRFLYSWLPAETGIGVVDSLLWSPLRAALERFDGVVAASSPEALAGYRLCTWVSFVTATPVLALLGAAALLASAACMAALDIVPSAVAFAGQLYVFYTAGG